MKELETRCSMTMPVVVTAINQIDTICKAYGLFAKIIDFSDAYLSYESGIYVVVCDRPIKDDINPYPILLRTQRNPEMLYLHDFSIRLTSTNAMVALRQILDFCKKTELMHALYQEFATTVPDSIGVSSFEHIKALNDGRYAKDKTEAYRISCKNNLSKYFSNEKKKQKNRDDRAVKSPVISMKELFSNTNKVSKLEVPEELYESFLTYLKNCYPNVKLSVSEKMVVDTGLLSVMKRRNSKGYHTDKQYVTAKAFYETLRKNFATEGWSCVKNMEAAYWEYRYVYYNRMDEPYVLEAYASLCHEFAQADSLFTLKERGTLCMVVLPTSLLYDFVAIAKANHVKFSIDNRRQFLEPCVSNVTILFNKQDESMMQDILGYLSMSLISDIYTA